MMGFEKVHIRAMRPEDEPHLFALAEACCPPGQLAVDETVGALSACDVFVAEHDGEVAGYVALVDERADVVIRQLLVATGHTERKVGDQLCDWAEGYAVSRGYDRLRVEASGQDQIARAFYTRRGYMPVKDGCLELRLPSLANAID
jgi:GNAT superfamily N-acetyltransferase